MNKKQREKSPAVMRRRIQIFASAMELFSEKGFDAVGIREIAAHAGVSKSLILLHFKSKEGLRAAVDKEVMQRFEDMLRGVWGGGEPIADVRSAAAGRADRLIHNLDEILPLLNYLRHSLLENSKAGHAMFRRYLEGLGHEHSIDLPKSRPKSEESVWFLLVNMFMQLGPILLESQIAAVIGRSPFHPESIKARTLIYASVGEKLREVQKSL